MKRIEEPIYITRPFLPPIEEYYEGIKTIWENQYLTNNGPIVREFAERLKTHLKVKNMSLFVNGTLALDCAIKALDLKGEIITTPFTFAATTHCIANNQIKPVFCDISLKDYNINVDSIESLINENTTAIMPVHVYGTPCDVKGIEKIAKKYNLKVLYDAAHAFGVEVNGKPIGEYGDMSMFSLHSTKVFHSIEGGAIVCKDEAYIKKMEALRNFGIYNEESIELIGTNAKMNEFQATMGILNLKYVDCEIEKRKKITRNYRSILKNIKGIRLLDEIENVKYSYSYFPILIEKEFGKSRDEVFEELKKFNIFARKYFYPLCSDFTCYSQNKSETLLNAQYVSENILTLPLYGQLTEYQVEYICNVLKILIVA